MPSSLVDSEIVRWPRRAWFTVTLLCWLIWSLWWFLMMYFWSLLLTLLLLLLTLPSSLSGGDEVPLYDWILSPGLDVSTAPSQAVKHAWRVSWNVECFSFNVICPDVFKRFLNEKKKTRLTLTRWIGRAREAHQNQGSVTLVHVVGVVHVVAFVLSTGGTTLTRSTKRVNWLSWLVKNTRSAGGLLSPLAIGGSRSRLIDLSIFTCFLSIFDNKSGPRRRSSCV